ncbi:MAG TPA: hypothetical protein VM223_00135 [Planctomycetota bacterium]|nr:hypothetical protein [Planctomycetota bacterium]
MLLQPLQDFTVVSGGKVLFLAFRMIIEAVEQHGPGGLIGAGRTAGHENGTAGRESGSSREHHRTPRKRFHPPPQQYAKHHCEPDVPAHLESSLYR